MVWNIQVDFFILIFLFHIFLILYLYINMSSRYLELAPTNKTTDNKYSFKKGVSQINFTIPEGNYVLDPSSVRIAGKITFFKNDNAVPEKPQPGEALGTNGRIGPVYSVIKDLTWRSSKHQTVISHERNYNRWMSSYLGITTSMSNSIGTMGEQMLTMPNYEASKESVVCRDTDSSFCVPLICGLLNSGQSLPLTGNTLGGLECSLTLESNAMALQVLPANFSTDPSTADFLSAYYELSDVQLICSVITPPPDQLSRLLSQKQGAITYQSIHSFYDTANSNNIQLSMNFSLKKVKSLFINVISSDKLNNIGQDSFATLPPMNSDGSQGSVQKISFLRGGTLFPKFFPRDTNVKETTDTIAQDPVLFRDYINAVTKYDGNTHTLGGVVNTNRGFLGKVSGGVNKGTPYQFVNNGGVFWGIGVNYDNYIGGSVDLSSQPFGLAMDCDLTSSNSQSLFIYVNAESNILWSESGVMLVQ